MIKITYNQLLVAASEGALQRFFALPKPIAVAVKNRKLPSLVEAELQAFYKLRDSVVESSGGVELATASVEWSELINTVIEIDASPIDVKHLTGGSMSERDLQLLEPFIKFED